MDRQAGRQSDRQTDRQTVRRMDRHVRHVPVCVGSTLHNFGNTSFHHYIISISDVKEVEFGVENTEVADLKVQWQTL